MEKCWLKTCQIMHFPRPKHALLENGKLQNACKFFANKWKFEQMEISRWKPLSFDKNGKILVENLSNNTLFRTKTHTFRKWKCTIRCNLFANKWKFEQMEI